MLNQLHKKRNRRSIILLILLLLAVGVIEYVYYLTPQEEAALHFLVAYKANDKEAARQYVSVNSEEALDQALSIFSSNENESSFLSEIEGIVNGSNDDRQTPRWNGSDAVFRYQDVICEPVTDTTAVCKVCCGVDDVSYKVRLVIEEEEWKVALKKEESWMSEVRDDMDAETLEGITNVLNEAIEEIGDNIAF